MFLSESPSTEDYCNTAQPVGLTLAENERLRKLKDNDVNYYGFICSQAYLDWHKSIEGKILTSDIYDSPYFGMQPSGAYADLDKVYEAYKLQLKINQPYIKEVITTSAGISPTLILAAAAAFFFAG